MILESILQMCLIACILLHVCICPGCTETGLLHLIKTFFLQSGTARHTAGHGADSDDQGSPNLLSFSFLLSLFLIYLSSAIIHHCFTVSLSPHPLSMDLLCSYYLPYSCLDRTAICKLILVN